MNILIDKTNGRIVINSLSEFEMDVVEEALRNQFEDSIRQGSRRSARLSVMEPPAGLHTPAGVEDDPD